MPTIITATQFRAVLGVSASLYSDTYLNQILNTAENIILPLLTQYKSALVAYSIETGVATLHTQDIHEFVEGQTITITGVAGQINGSKTIIDVSPETFTVATAASDLDLHPLDPHGEAVHTGNGADYYIGVPGVESAVYVVANEIFSSRIAPGGTIESVDFAPASPFRLGRSLMNRVTGLLGPYLDVEAMIG